MRSKFDQQLALLNEELTQMGETCAKAIGLAAQALDEQNASTAAPVAELEEQTNEQERSIEALCLKLLLQQQPVARDLRQISAALKMITDMERIGDQAADIAEIVTYTDLSESTNGSHIAEMGAATTKMVTEAVEAFVRRDRTMAQSVVAYDDVVDDLFSSVKHDIMQMIAADPARGEQAVDILMISKYLERIGDHAVNIAEWVIFAITGKHENE